MLDSLTLLCAMNGIHEEDVVMAGIRYFENQKNRNVKKTVSIVLLAAVLVSLLTVGAYSMGFLGMKAIVIPETATVTSEIPSSVTQPQASPEEAGASIKESEAGKPANALVSITQPQAVPEGLGTEVNEKIENAKAAWDEWRTWRGTNPDSPHNPEVFAFPAGAVVCNEEENEDGSYTLSYYDKGAWALIHKDVNADPDYSAAAPFVVRVATAEEKAAHEAWMNYLNFTYGDYDFNYDIHNEQEAAKLEEIAAKYGLRLRRGQTLLWSKETVEESDAEWNAKYGTNLHTDTSDPRFLTNQELCQRISDIACNGDLFRETPRGFDKVYYFDDGTFCVSYDQELPDGRRIRCYGYNSMYATLSSGREVVSQITDPEQFLTRTYTALDGTELTIMQKGNEAFLYVYLEESFYEMHMQCDTTLSDEDVNRIADNLNYHNIGNIGG